MVVVLRPSLDELLRQSLAGYVSIDRMPGLSIGEDTNAPDPIGYLTDKGKGRPFPFGELGGSLDAWRLPVDGHPSRITRQTIPHFAVR